MARRCAGEWCVCRLAANLVPPHFCGVGQSGVPRTLPLHPTAWRMEDAPEVTRLFDKLRATDEAAECGSLDSTHYRDVDVAIAEVLQQLSPIHCFCSTSSISDDSMAQETKGKEGYATTDEAANPESAKKLQALLAQHKGPRRKMVEDEGALKTLQELFPFLDGGELEEMLTEIDRREEMQANLDEASSDGGRCQPGSVSENQVQVKEQCCINLVEQIHVCI